MTGGAAGSAPAHPLRLALGVALAVAAGFLAIELYLLDGGLGFPLDDSFIHLRFAREIAAGRGLSYDGERLVTGSTAPLWTALVSLAFLLPGSPLAWVKLLGVAAQLGAVAAAHRLARELDLPAGLSRLAAVLVAMTGWLAWSALGGMEVPLFAALSLAGMALHVAERRDPGRPPLSAAVLGLAGLARPEGWLLLLLAAAEAAARWWPRARGAAWPPPPRRRWALWGLFAALAAGPVLAVYAVAGGSPLPTTFAAKGAGLARPLPDLGYVQVVLGLLLRQQPWMTLLAAGGAAALAVRLGGPRDRGLLVALWAFTLPLGYSLLSPPGRVVVGNFGRYFFPLLPVVVVLGAVALEPLATSLAGAAPRGRRWRPAAIALLVVPTAAATLDTARLYGQSVVNVQDSDVKVAAWLAARLPATAVLAVNDIGALGYRLPNPLLDLAGIVNPEVKGYTAAAQRRGEPWEQGIMRFLAERRPDYLVVFPAWFPSLAAAGSPFQPRLRLAIPDNITMGGEELVVFATPWTRFPLPADSP